MSLIMPICLGLAATGVVVNMAQTKGMFSTQTLKPSFSKLNPLTGFKRMFSMQSIVELGKAIVKIGICGFIGYQLVAEKYPRFLELENGSLPTAAGFIGGVAIELGFKVGGVLLAMAALDYLYQRQKFEKSLKMSHQDIKEEARSAEGDPQLKGRIRATQRQMARRRMMQDVPTADVVLTNPTHLAVALKYDPKKKTAPVVVAKGADLIAEQIKKIARENRVPVMENRPLARAIYKMVEIGDEIPGELFQAVAEVLAFIYHLKSTGRQYVS
jgi:flagellar biosynthetic protein FlhB